MSSEMTIEEAFSLLDLPITASEKEIDKAFRSKSKKYHPDKAGGDINLQKRLGKACDVAREYVKKRNAIVPLEVNELIQQVKQSIVTQQASNNAGKSVIVAKRNKTRTLQRYKSTMWIVGGISALLALLGDNLLPILPDSEVLRTGFVLMTLAFGLIGLTFQQMISGLENKIDAYMENLSDKRECAKELAEVLSYHDSNEISKEDIINLVKRSSKNRSKDRLINLLYGRPTWSVEELLSILLFKSEEHGLIIPIDQKYITPESKQMYHLGFKPSVFSPPIESKMERITIIDEKKPMTKKEALSLLGIGTGWIVIFSGATIYLSMSVSSLWSILTGILILPGVSFIIIPLTEFFGKRKAN